MLKIEELFDGPIPFAQEGVTKVARVENYRRFTIKKRNGSLRTLFAIEYELKRVQKDISEELEQKFAISKHAYAFVSALATQTHHLDQALLLRKRGVISNAYQHCNKKLVISIDLKDFFPTISLPRVLGLLKSKPYSYSHQQALRIATIACLPKGIDPKQGLPQGAPSSPIISNLICRKLDYQLGNLAKKFNMTYTRYADDLTFSTNNIKKVNPKQFVEIVRTHVDRNGFVINDEKTKVMYSNHRQMVTGIVVNDGLNLSKSYVDALRATLHNLEHQYSSIEESIFAYRIKKNKFPFEAYVPLTKSNEGTLLHTNRKSYQGPSKKCKVNKEQAESIYASHILGRILWYGQVVTTGISEPYNSKAKHLISPKQLPRIIKFEKMLASYYRIAIKRNWNVEKSFRKFRNKYDHLRSLSLTQQSKFSLTSRELTDAESRLVSDASNLKNKEGSLYKLFFKDAPNSLQRAIETKSRKLNFYEGDLAIELTKKGWPIPIKQQVVLDAFDNGVLSNLLHSTKNKEGHSVLKLVNDMVNNINPEYRYLSDDLKLKIKNVHRALIELLNKHGENTTIQIYSDEESTKEANQTIRELKAAIRLNDDDVDNFYTKVVVPALELSKTKSLFDIEYDDMAARFYTDVNAWRDCLTKLLMSIKEHNKLDEDTTKIGKISFSDADPIDKRPRSLSISIYRKNAKYKRNLDIKQTRHRGKLKKYILGGDMNTAVESFLPVGIVNVEGNFKDVNQFKVNLSHHTFVRSKPESQYPLIFSMEELATNKNETV